MSNELGKESPSQAIKPNQKISLVRRDVHFSAPLPPPGLLESYDRIVPGMAERLLAMAEADAKHQRDIEAAALNAETRGVRRGQVLGCLVVLAALSVATFCAYCGHEIAASTIGGTTVLGLATCFVLGRKADATQKQPRKKK